MVERQHAALSFVQEHTPAVQSYAAVDFNVLPQRDPTPSYVQRQDHGLGGSMTTAVMRQDQSVPPLPQNSLMNMNGTNQTTVRLPMGPQTLQLEVNEGKTTFKNFPSHTSRLPNGISFGDVCRYFPNHLWGRILLEFETSGRWTMQQVWNACHASGRHGGNNGREWNYLQQRLIRARQKSGLSKPGPANPNKGRKRKAAEPAEDGSQDHSLFPQEISQTADEPSRKRRCEQPTASLQSDLHSVADLAKEFNQNLQLLRRICQLSGVADNLLPTRVNEQWDLHCRNWLNGLLARHGWALKGEMANSPWAAKQLLKSYHHIMFRSLGTPIRLQGLELDQWCEGILLRQMQDWSRIWEQEHHRLTVGLSMPFPRPLLHSTTQVAPPTNQAGPCCSVQYTEAQQADISAEQEDLDNFVDDIVDFVPKRKGEKRHVDQGVSAGTAPGSPDVFHLDTGSDFEGQQSTIFPEVSTSDAGFNDEGSQSAVFPNASTPDAGLDVEEPQSTGFPDIFDLDATAEFEGPQPTDFLGILDPDFGLDIHGTPPELDEEFWREYFGGLPSTMGLEEAPDQ